METTNMPFIQAIKHTELCLEINAKLTDQIGLILNELFRHYNRYGCFYTRTEINFVKSKS